MKACQLSNSEANLICADILKNGIERSRKYHLKRVRFADIPVGACFEFTAAREFPHSGAQLGPWVKVSTRKYTKPSAEYEVGTIQTTVFLITEI